jgi:hypothetical protein
MNVKNVNPIKSVKPAKIVKEIDFQGQLPYCELPFNMDTINNFQKYRTMILVFEGIEGDNKKFKYIRINEPIKYMDRTEDWDNRFWPTELILKRLLYILYLGVWANMDNLTVRAKKQINTEKVNKYEFEAIIRENKIWNIENYKELKLLFQKLLEKKINRVYIVYQDRVNLEGPNIKENLESKGYTEWDIDNVKNKNTDITILATKYFSLKNIKSVREEASIYIKDLETKYNKELEKEKIVLEATEKSQNNDATIAPVPVNIGGRKKHPKKN